MIPTLTLAIVSVLSQPLPLNSSSVCSVTSMECSVMSFSTIGHRPYISITALAQSMGKVGYEPDQLSPAEQIALLKCKAWDHHARSLYDEYLARGVMHPRSSDFRKLVCKNLARLDTVSGYHKLTPHGKSAVDTLIMRRFGMGALHAVSVVGEQSFPSTQLKCTCGWRTSVDTRSNGQSKITAARTNHLRTSERVAELFGAMARPAKA